MSTQNDPAADTGPMIDHRPEEDELRSAVHELVTQYIDRATAQRSPIPGVGTDAWWTAPADTQLAAVLILGEAWLIHDPVRTVRERLRQMSWDLSGACCGKLGGPSHAILAERRAQPGSTARAFDPAAAARWVATGHSGDATPA